MRRFATVAVAAGMLLALTGTTSAFASNPNGSGGDMPAYYDDQVFTINFKLLKPDLHHNPSFNVIYQFDSCANSGLKFVSVLDAIQGDGSTLSGRKSRSTSTPASSPSSSRRTPRSWQPRRAGRSP